MAPKQQLDKSAWQWAEKVDPNDITQEHIETAYRVKLKPCKNCRRNCKGNPRCLLGLGEGQWFVDIDDSAWHDIEDPTQEIREKGDFVGLKNLGATCYVNTLLQLWFHNREFRHTMFRYQDNPAVTDAAQTRDNTEQTTQQTRDVTMVTDEKQSTPGECDSVRLLSNDSSDKQSLLSNEEREKRLLPSTVGGHLQLIFALLQHSDRKYIDPTAFINSLGLDAALQQDAQEFSKLFMCVLEETLSQQQDVGVRTLIQRQFMGQYDYVTRCQHCSSESRRASEYYELDLNIKGHKTLHECIQEFLQEEKLCGDNQYQCTACNCKRDAVRSIKLHKLPPVLNLQLLRFVFERKTGHKKKLNTHIQFQETLDMSSYLGQPEGQSVYDLCAVLIHRGPSAYSGHYVAHIKDQNTKTWYKFNDEQIEKMGSKSLHLGDEEDVEGKGGGKKPKVGKGFHASRNAYMLVYQQQGAQQPRASLQEAPQQLALQHPVSNQGPPQQAISTQPALGQPALIQEALQQRASIQVHSEALEQRASDVRPQEQGAATIPIPVKIVRNKYATDEMSPRGPSAQGASQKGPPKEIGLEELPQRVKDYIKFDNQRFTEWIQDMTNQMDKNVETGKAKQSEIRNLYSSLQFKEGESYDWLSTDWLIKWLTTEANAVVAKVDNSSLLCQHHKLHPDKVTSAKCVKSETTVLLYTKYGGGPRIASDQVCDACVRERCREIHNKAKLSEDFKLISMVLKNTVNTGNTAGWYWIGKNSLRSWRRLAALKMEEKEDGKQDNVEEEKKEKSKELKETNEEEKTENGRNGETKENNDEEEENLSFNEDLLCPDHGELDPDDKCRKLIPPQVWERLKDYFPHCAEFTSDAHVCRQCLAADEAEKQKLEMQKTLSVIQKSELGDLFHDRKRPAWDTQFTVNALNVVSVDFVEQWRRFIKDPMRHEPITEICNSSILCDHGRFMYEPETVGLDDTSKRLQLIRPSEWTTMTQHFKCDREIVINRIKEDSGQVTFVVSPDVCSECLNSRARADLAYRLQYTEGVIYVRKVTDDIKHVYNGNHGDTGDEKDESRDTISDCESSINSSYTSPPPAKIQRYDSPKRRSSRHRKVRGEREVTMASTQTLRDLKLKIMKLFSVAPFDQHLMLDGQTLSGDQKTLADLQILPYSTVYLKCDEPVDDPTYLDDLSKAPAPEEGFKGTGLLGRSTVSTLDTSTSSMT